MKKLLSLIGILAVLGAGIIAGSGLTGSDPNGPWADVVVDHHQGLRKDGTPVLAERSDTSKALGAAEMSGAQGTFYSLGFDGWIILKMNSPVWNGPGDDIELWEVTWGAYPLEKVEVWVSQDGADYQLAGTASNTNGTANVRASTVGLPSCMLYAKYILLKDVTKLSDFASIPEADGYDLTGVKALHCAVDVDIDIKPGSYPNSINLNNGGNVPVCVFSNPSFDATTIDLSTVVFAGATPLSIGQSPQDINNDGLMDMVFHFSTQTLNLTATSTSASIYGFTTGGQAFTGSDSVRIISK